ncbi:DUF6498-containing protein [Microscilla marina]|uniref:DUF6498-containing protein n=1 Tax=Microscilla marina TaxID=1027 RepID=UPI0005D479A3|nr:DUF6498-containing protein [Microscilla marina]
MQHKARENVRSSVIIVILVNLLPIFGVLVLHWKVSDVVMLYVFETFVVGVFNVFKMIFAGTDDDMPGCMKIFLVPFFIVHYNVFVGIQGFFIISFVLLPELNNANFMTTPSGSGYTVSAQDYLLGILQFNSLLSVAYLSIVLSHLYSFVKNYLVEGENKNVVLLELMFQPYKRIFLQQFLVIGGTFLLLALGGNNMVFVVLLVVLKIFLDFRAHIQERLKYQPNKKSIENHQESESI